MIKYLPFVIAIMGGLSLAFFLLRADESTEPPDGASQLGDTQACPVPSETPEIAAEPSGGLPESTPHVQSEEEAIAQDLALIAEGNGWTLEQARVHLRASEAIDPISSRLAAERPDVYIGAALAEEPGGPPKIYIKGPADQFVREIVGGAELQIDIVDGQPYSRAELDERKAQLVEALQEWGFANFSAGADITNRGQIEANVVRQAGLPEEANEILASLPADLRDGVTLTVSDASFAGCGD